MKKFFIALSVLAALLLGVAPSQALVGMPDDVPARDFIVPFICSTDLTSGTGLNTLIALTEIGGVTGVKPASTATKTLSYDYDIMTVKSKTVKDTTITGTSGSVTSLNAKTLVASVSDTLLPDLEITIDGVKYYAGYVYFEDNIATSSVFATNHVLAQMLLVDLAAGRAASVNVPGLEWNDSISGALSQANMAPGTRNVEKFSPDALASAMMLQEGVTEVAASATFFGLYPRFYIPASGDANWLINWQCANATVDSTTVVGNNLNEIHINVYRADEDVESTTIRWPNELNVLDVDAWLPRGIFPAATFPKEGWFDFRWDNIAAGDFPDVNDIRDLSFFAFNYMITSGSSQEAWTVVNAVPRRGNFR